MGSCKASLKGLFKGLGSGMFGIDFGISLIFYKVLVGYCPHLVAVVRCHIRAIYKYIMYIIQLRQSGGSTDGTSMFSLHRSVHNVVERN